MIYKLNLTRKTLVKLGQIKWNLALWLVECYDFIIFLQKKWHDITKAKATREFFLQSCNAIWIALHALDKLRNVTALFSCNFFAMQYFFAEKIARVLQQNRSDLFCCRPSAISFFFSHWNCTIFLDGYTAFEFYARAMQ